MPTRPFIAHPAQDSTLERSGSATIRLRSSVAQWTIPDDPMAVEVAPSGADYIVTWTDPVNGTASAIQVLYTDAAAPALPATVLATVAMGVQQYTVTAANAPANRRFALRGTNGAVLGILSDPFILSAFAAKDEFGRTLAEGWGLADIGGAYEYHGASAITSTSYFSTAGGVGRIITAAGTRHGVLIDTGTNLRTRFRVSTDLLSVGADGRVLHRLRHKGIGTAYELRVDLRTTLAVRLALDKRVSGTATAITGTYVVPGLTHTANTFYWVESEVEDVNATDTTIRLKVWQDGQAEPPSPQITWTHAEPVLRGLGGVGLGWTGLAGYEGTVTISYDDLTAVVI
jgi:hypothetical protein